MVNIIANNTPAFKKGDPEPKLAEGKARLFSNRFCIFSEKVLLYCAAKGIEVEVVNVNLMDKPEWYFNKHPQGQVPAFEKDGKIVIDSGVIPGYLDDIYPASSILPTDPYLKAKQRILLEQTSSISVNFFGLYAIIRGKLTGEAKDAKIQPVVNALDQADKLLKDDYFGGSSAGHVDWMLFPFIERIALLSSLLSFSSPFPGPRFPSLSNWWTRISVHPAVAAVTQPTGFHLEYMDSFLAGKPDYDVGL